MNMVKKRVMKRYVEHLAEVIEDHIDVIKKQADLVERNHRKIVRTTAEIWNIQDEEEKSWDKIKQKTSALSKIYWKDFEGRRLGQENNSAFRHWPSKYRENYRNYT